MMFPNFELTLPNWIDGFVEEAGDTCTSAEARMRFAIELARWNVLNGTGGPFGAAIFEIESGRLVAPGVNLVVPANAAIAHAEMVAITLAGQRFGNFDLGSENLPDCELVTSSEPCAMCFGAVPWSGVKRLVYGASAAVAEAIGFDEGPKPIEWQAALEARGIEVVREMLHDEAARVFDVYQAQGGLIYNGRLGD